MATSADTILLLRGVLLDDYWLVTTPREGTLFVRAESNAWPFLKETLVPVWFSTAMERPGRILADGSPGEESGVAIGITGRFAAARQAVEHYEISALDRQRDSHSRPRSSIESAGPAGRVAVTLSARE